VSTIVVVTFSGVPSVGGIVICGRTGWILLLTKVSFTRHVMRLDLPLPSSPQTQIRTDGAHVSCGNSRLRTEALPVAMISDDMRLTRVNFRLEIWTRLGGRSVQCSGLGAQCGSWKVAIIMRYYASQSISIGPTFTKPLAIDVWPAYGSRGGRSYSQPQCAKEKRLGCASKIDTVGHHLTHGPT
jgi:hypothetical protein